MQKKQNKTKQTNKKTLAVRRLVHGKLKSCWRGETCTALALWLTDAFANNKTCRPPSMHRPVQRVQRTAFSDQTKAELPKLLTGKHEIPQRTPSRVTSPGKMWSLLLLRGSWNTGNLLLDLHAVLFLLTSMMNRPTLISCGSFHSLSLKIPSSKGDSVEKNAVCWEVFEYKKKEHTGFGSPVERGQFGKPAWVATVQCQSECGVQHLLQSEKVCGLFQSDCCTFCNANRDYRKLLTVKPITY